MSAVLSQRELPSAWRQPLLALGCLLLALLLLYRETFAAMAGIWSRSDTFAHCFLVPPISLWLVWRQREQLQRLDPKPLYWTLVPMVGAAVAWLVGDLAGVNALTQTAVTALLVLAVPAVLGGAVGRAILFPLCFLFFMVPVGEFVMPQMMQWTADVTVFTLKAFGIPVYREGLQFVIPSGTWSVVEACSGVRYLIASFMVGTLFAYLNYCSAGRRFLFGIVALVVPVVANWARAILIVMLGHLSGNKLAAGADHLVYGWVFFGVVIAVMFFIGARWSEAPVDPEANAVPMQPVADAGRTGPVRWVAATAAALVLGTPHLVSWQLMAAGVQTPVLALPPLAGLAAAADAKVLHKPLFEGARAESVRVYGELAQAVTVHVAYYRQQTYGHKLISSQNVLVASNDNEWHRTSAGERAIVVGTTALALRSAELRAGAVGTSTAGQRLQVRQIYWVAGRLTAKDHLAAGYGVLGAMTGRGDDAAAITFYMADDGSGGAERALDAFVARHLPTLTAWLDTVRAAR